MLIISTLSFRKDLRGAVHLHLITNFFELVSLFASFFAIPLACQCCFHATLFTGLQIVGVTLHFLDNVLLLNLALKPAQSVFERLAFLYANLCQEIPPPNPPNGFYSSYLIPHHANVL
jgi:hypothetical protein